MNIIFGNRKNNLKIPFNSYEFTFFGLEYDIFGINHYKEVNTIDSFIAGTYINPAKSVRYFMLRVIEENPKFEKQIYVPDLDKLIVKMIKTDFFNPIMYEEVLNKYERSSSPPPSFDIIKSISNKSKEVADYISNISLSCNSSDEFIERASKSKYTNLSIDDINLFFNTYMTARLVLLSNIKTLGKSYSIKVYNYNPYHYFIFNQFHKRGAIRKSDWIPEVVLMDNVKTLIKNPKFEEDKKWKNINSILEKFGVFLLFENLD